MLPALAFNETRSDRYVDQVSIFKALDDTFPRCFDFLSLVGKSELAFKSSNLEINGLRLSAIANTPLSIKRNALYGNDLWIPIHGYTVIETQGNKFRLDSGHSAFLGSTGDRCFRTSTQSAVCIHLNQDRLNATHAAMVGPGRAGAITTCARTLPLEINRISFQTLFTKIFEEIDALDGNPQALAQLTVDDSLYRLCVGLIQPEIFANRGAGRSERAPAREEIALLCEFLRANLTQPISLTRMEQLSGLSSRVLQYSFKKQFGLRPKEWHRKQRLHGARAMLCRFEGNLKISSLAFDFGFPSASDFSHRYRLEFGELPSETISKKSWSDGRAAGPIQRRLRLGDMA